VSVEIDERIPRSRWFVPALVVGWAIIGVGAWSALNDSADANPLMLVIHIVAFDLGHDLVVAPLLVGGAWLITRVVPAVARGPVRAAGAVSALLVVISFPVVRGLGRRPTNPSTLPLDYGGNVILILIGVWALAAASIVIRVTRARRRA